jgi:two-component system sensor histidine kinase UhpB
VSSSHRFGMFVRASHPARGGGSPTLAFAGRGAAAGALLLAVAYYAGAVIGFAFKAQDAPQSVMWVPNALLLAALLLVPPRQWFLYLLAAFPAHLLIAWQNRAPLDTLSLLYITNAMDAALAAAAMNAASRGRWRLDSLRSLLILFAFGGVLSPALISFADAGITVLTGWSRDFATSYGTRVRANMLTNIIVVPTIVAAFSASFSTWRRRMSRRSAEVIALFGGLLLTCTAVFSVSLDGRIAFVYLPIPFLLWAAVRFGPGVTGAALFLVALVSSWNVVRGDGAFSGMDSESNVIALQFFLLCVSVPLLSLSMVVQERMSESTKLIESRDEIRRAMERVRQLAGRLISVQEEERSRIARELHDNIGQYVADVAVTVSAVKRAPAVRGAGLDAEFHRIYEQTSHLFENMRALSHQLHPSILRHAGLAAATESLCRAFRQQRDIDVEFAAPPLDPIPDDIALCAYRVAQEALRNVAAHAGAAHVRVHLNRIASLLSLTITDDGRGFDADVARTRGGLGIVAMEERVRLVQGEIDITSGPDGSRIEVRIPVPAFS